MWGRPEALSFIPDKLEEIVSRRNRIAHTSDALGEARSALVESHRFILTLAIALDEELEQYVQWIQANPGKDR